jgi:uncharacterized damage-inducible protein DinB
MEESSIETWQIHNRIHLYLLEAIPQAALGAVSASEGRTIGEQVAHVHTVRLMWLSAAAPMVLGSGECAETAYSQALQDGHDSKVLSRFAVRPHIHP